MKKFLCVVLSIVLSIGVLPYQAFAEEVVSEEVAVEAVSKEEVSEAVSKAPSEVADLSGSLAEHIEINQGFSKHTKREGGEQTYISEFAAGKTTAIMMKIPGSESMTKDLATDLAETYIIKVNAVVNGRESDDFELYDTLEDRSIKVIKAYDRDCNPESGWYLEFILDEGFSKGVYNFRITDSEDEEIIGESLGIRFYDTTDLNVLIVPVKAYWGKAIPGHAAPRVGAFSCKDGQFTDFNGNKRNWSELRGTIETYLKDVYPTANVKVAEGREIDASSSEMDLCTNYGMRDLWRAACKRQVKTKNGKDKYDIILAFVQYRQGKDGSIQGYTYTRPANIITYTDGDMLPTVGHEIAHCYDIGDEYQEGTYNPEVNLPPRGYEGAPWTGRGTITITEGDWQDPEMYAASTTDAKKAYINNLARGTMIPLSLHPFSLSNERMLTWEGVDENGNAKSKTSDSVYPTMCFMGSNYSKAENYWNSCVNWDHLLKSLAVKERKNKEADKEAASDSYTNIDVFNDATLADATDDSIIESDDLYYDDEYRFGESGMVEVSGHFTAGEEGKTVTMDPMFSYRGDLEYIDPLDDEYTEDVYTFAALNSDGNIINSPTDKLPSIVEFYAGPWHCTREDLADSSGEFCFDAEYPEGTADFAIYEGRLNEDGSHGKEIWRASEDKDFFGDFKNTPEGWLTWSEYDEGTGDFTVEWEIDYPDGSDQLYTEVYYFPEGDDGESYYVTSSDDDDLSGCAITFNTGEFETAWTRNAFVWVKVTNGVNATDIYSDDNEVNLSRSMITLSGGGVKAKNGVYTAEYSGKEITPQVTVKAYDPLTDNYIQLKRDQDYRVSYEDNTGVGTARVSVEGIGEYTGKNWQTFEITGKKIDGTPESIPDMKYTADLDNDVKPYLVVKDKNGSQMGYEEDFIVGYTVDGRFGDKLSKLITTAPETKKEVTVTYKGIGNYTGELRKQIKFSVLPTTSEAVILSNDNTTITLKSDSAEYTGKPIKPAVKSVTVKVDGVDKTLKSSDYSIVYTNNINLGTARVTVTGKKNYAGSAYKTYEIKAKQVKSLSIKGLFDQAYTGKDIDAASLPIEVKAGGITLKKGRDYTVESEEGCNYKDVTTAKIKKDKKSPKVVVKLKELSESELKKARPADRPIVRWSDKVDDSKKKAEKTFNITAIKINSGAVTVSQKNSDQSENKVKSADGTKAIATLRAKVQSEKKEKYSFVIEGAADSLEKNAVLTDALAVKANGGDLKSGTDYVITVSAAKNGKIGTITIKSVKNGICTGSRTVKFLYNKKTSE